MQIVPNGWTFCIPWIFFIFSYLTSLSIFGQLFTLLGILTLVAWIGLRIRYVRLADAIPGLPCPPTLLGSIVDLQKLPFVPNTEERDFVGYYTNHTNEFRKKGIKTWRMWAFHKYLPIAHPLTVIADPEHLSELLSLKLASKLSKGTVYDISFPLIGRGLLSTEGADWKLQRKIANPGFKSALLSNAVDHVEATLNDLSQRWDSRIKAGTSALEFNIYEDMLLLTIDVLGKVAFGYEFNSVRATKPDDAPLYATFKYILKYIPEKARKPSIFHLLPFEAREFNQQIATLNRVVEDIVSARSKSNDNKQESPKYDLLSCLLEPDQATGKPALTQKQIVDNIKTFLFAGHDTTASALAWSLYEIALRPEIQNKLRQEIEKEFGNEIKSLTINDFKKLPYLDAFVKEILRLHPSAGFMRSPHEDLKLGNFILPAKSAILILPTLPHTDADYWKDPLEFNPDRWLTESASRNKAYLPFSIGPRNCIGEPLASIEIRYTLTYLLSHFRFTLHQKSIDVPPQQTLLLTLAPSPIYVVPERLK